MIFTDTITIYSYYKDNGAEKWHRTVLKGVMWKRKRVQSVNIDGKLNIVDTVSITIPYRALYLPYKEFLLSSDRLSHWTIETASNLSVAVLGECDKEIGDNYRLKDLKRDYSDVVTLKSLADNTNRDHLKNWKVIGA
jgi:hypothetical protein|nr:MAG TPA: hypothetical protein [Caudoviricetes sp.]